MDVLVGGRYGNTPYYVWYISICNRYKLVKVYYYLWLGVLLVLLASKEYSNRYIIIRVRGGTLRLLKIRGSSY